MLNRHDSNDRNGSSLNGAISKIEQEDGFGPTVGMTPSIAIGGWKEMPFSASWSSMACPNLQSADTTDRQAAGRVPATITSCNMRQ